MSYDQLIRPDHRDPDISNHRIIHPALMGSVRNRPDHRDPDISNHPIIHPATMATVAGRPDHPAALRPVTAPNRVTGTKAAPSRVSRDDPSSTSSIWDSTVAGMGYAWWKFTDIGSYLSGLARASAQAGLESGNTFARAPGSVFASEGELRCSIT